MQHAFLNIAERAAYRAAKIISQASSRLDLLKIEEKQPNDLVSQVDRSAEWAIIDELSQSFPKHGILSEEKGLVTEGDGIHKWIIDPLDGTMNFVHGIPHYSISIACMVKNQIEHGLVYDPGRNEFFYASRGCGAYVDNKRIRVSGCPDLKHALVATGIPFGELINNHELYLPAMQEIMLNCQGLRRLGSAALDLAYVAAGRIDAFWTPGLKCWDIAAGALLVKEAGGRVSDFSGGQDYLESGDIISASPHCLAEITDIVQKHWPSKKPE